jgi:thiamine pyrophosphate-dependent acetolactate synthase large subunit-like protein
MSKPTLQPALQRRPLVKKILDGADDNLLVIAGLGSSNWDVTEAGDRPLNMPLWGAMGAPVGMGLGLALAQPGKRVLVITGDGDMLMSLGSLATVATQQPENLAIVVLDNEKFGETGNQATHTSPRNNGPTESGAGTDLSLVAKGCGIADTGIVREAGEVAQLVKDVRTGKGPVFRVVKVRVEKLEFVMPPQDGAHLKDRFRQALLGTPRGI